MAFRDIAGQKTPIRILKGLLRSGRLPHALLFTGEPGVGKLFTAINFLKTLICKNREDFDCCDRCRTCSLINSFSFPDLRFVRPEKGQIKIETIREVNEFLNMSPYEASFKMVLIDEAERLNVNAANAFLKTLEEPPGDALIILVSEKPDALPDTLRSRCITVPFTPLSREETIEVLRRHESQGEKSYGLISGSSHLKDNFSLLYEGRPGILLDEGFRRYMELFERLAGELSGAGGSKDRTAENKDLSREDLRQAIEIVLIYLRNRMVQSINSSQSQSFSREEIQGIIKKYQKILALRELGQFNLNIKLTWNYIKATLLSP